MPAPHCPALPRRNPQLALLHLCDLTQAQRGSVVCANPQLLVADVEGCLLPLLDYLSARLGMQADQVARCLEEEKAYGAPETLDTLSEWQAGG